MLILNGFYHFKNTYDGYKKTGNWELSSYSTIPFINIGTRTDIDELIYYNPNGINQSNPLVKPETIAINDVRNMSSGNNFTQEQARDRANETYLLYRTKYDDFFGNKIMINSERGGNNWSFLGTIHTSKAFMDSYKTKGLNSKAGLLLMHEYGHYLNSQYEPLNWYGYGMWSSMYTRNDLNASSNWTEIQANTMSYYYFHMPPVFLRNIDDYPIDVNSISQELKIKLYYHRKL